MSDISEINPAASAWMVERKGQAPYAATSVEFARLAKTRGATVTNLYATPQPTETQRIVAAYIDGATAVHEEWCRAHEAGEGPPRGDPEFGEAASDYAASVASGEHLAGEGER